MKQRKASMWNKLTQIGCLFLLFSRLASAGEALPSTFEGHNYQPSDSPYFGCSGLYDDFTLSLDLINNVYTKIDSICDRGIIHVRGVRGDLQQVDGKIKKTQKEWAYSSKGQLPLEWRSVEPADDGYFTFDEKNQKFDEYAEDGAFLFHW